MPLNEDPAAISDEEYAALVDEMYARAVTEGGPPCRVAVPADELVAALARLDAQDG